MSEEWTGSKRQKEALREKFGGRCAYCGGILKSMHADHLEPVIRVQTDPWGKVLPKAEQRMVRPEFNVVENMVPSCPPCNIHKGGYRLDQWRDLIGRAADVLARDKSIFRTACRFGVIEVKSGPVVFYFETLPAPVEGVDA